MWISRLMPGENRGSQCNFYKVFSHSLLFILRLKAIKFIDRIFSFIPHYYVCLYIYIYIYSIGYQHLFLMLTLIQVLLQQGVTYTFIFVSELCIGKLVLNFNSKDRTEKFFIIYKIVYIYIYIYILY